MTRIGRSVVVRGGENMQEWMIAMLALSIMLIVRDMAKTILSGKGRRMEEAFPLYESHPQKEKVEK